MQLRYSLVALCGLILLSSPVLAQERDLPHELATFELDRIEAYRNSRGSDRGITTPPPFPVRTMAEWEEVQSLVVSWTSYLPILKQIVRYAKDECEVIIVCDNANDVTNYLNNTTAGGPLPDMNNITLLVDDFNSIWMRDYGAECIYKNEVDSVMLLDWIYNRPRPLDDDLPEAIAAFKNIPIYSTTQAPYDLVHTGGNFMTDGFGTAFSSNLVLDENGPSGQFNQTVKTTQQVDDIMEDFMGIDQGRYIKMDVLPFDAIHHIDMHMKLLDEETLLVGEFPTGLSDGPQLEANMQYVLSNYNSMFGTPYKLVRIPMPPSTGGLYPPQGYYRTFTNSIFINNTILVPTYRQEYDTIGMRIYSENLPGYNIVGIDCDDPGANIISASGALHCITKTIGVDDPLLISHQPLPDTNDDQNPYIVVAYMNHRSSIAGAALYWSTTPGAGYTSVPMNSTGNNNWSGDIPAQPFGSEVYYYVEGTANSGKQQVRPIVAPSGYWDFKVDGSVSVQDISSNAIGSIYPNPASAITVVPVNMKAAGNLILELHDATGRSVQTLHNGNAPGGEKLYFFDAATLNAGAYLVIATTTQGRSVQRVIVR